MDDADALYRLLANQGRVDFQRSQNTMFAEPDLHHVMSPTPSSVHMLNELRNHTATKSTVEIEDITEEPLLDQPEEQELPSQTLYVPKTFNSIPKAESVPSPVTPREPATPMQEASPPRAEPDPKSPTMQDWEQLFEEEFRQAQTPRTPHVAPSVAPTSPPRRLRRLRRFSGFRWRPRCSAFARRRRGQSIRSRRARLRVKWPYLGKLRVLSGRSRSKPPSIVTWFTPPALFRKLNVGLLLLEAPAVVLLLLLTLCTLFSA